MCSMLQFVVIIFVFLCLLDETKCQRFYNFACGFSAVPAKKLDPKELKEHLRKMHDISENKTTSRLCDISAVVAVAATCAIIGFYA